MTNMMEVDKIQEGDKFRYPGTASFADDLVSQSVFFGRDQDVVQLADRIASDRLTVIYGKSGIGKTSLLNAGLFPRLRNLGFAPIVIRPREITIAWDIRIRSAIDNMVVNQQLQMSVSSGEKYRNSLECFLADIILTHEDKFLIPVIVIDQFEEIFRISGDIKNDFTAVMETLVGPGHQLRKNIPDLRIVLSLREEFVGALDEFAHTIPGVLANRYRLNPLTHDGAKEAITKPAVLPGLQFESPCFDYIPGFVDDLLKYLGDKESFEPIQLQVVCRYIEFEVIRRKNLNVSYSPVSHTTIFEENSFGFKRILEQFYVDTINLLNSEIDRKRAQELCEYGLVSSDGYRDSIPEEKIVLDFKVSSETLDQLVDSRLLRRENRLNDLWYEITHDRLAEAIVSRRRFRLPKSFWVYLIALLVALSGIFLAFIVETKRSSDLRKEQQISKTTLQELRTRNAYIEARSREIEALKLRLKNASQSMTTELIQRGGLRLPKMVEIASGKFQMGDSSDSPFSLPLHDVKIERSFRISKYEITFAQYDQFATELGISLPSDNGWGRKNRPVINVSWNNAKAYANWLTEKARINSPSEPVFRLPTETEWEYAARAGSIDNFGFGNDPAKLCLHANHADISLNLRWSNRNCSDSSGFTTSPVGTYKKNSFGVNDMLGNVSEWVEDCWRDNYSLDSDSMKNLKPDSCRRRSVRGGSWFDSSQVLGVGKRDWYFNNLGNETIGFRIVQNLE